MAKAEKKEVKPKAEKKEKAEKVGPAGGGCACAMIWPLAGSWGPSSGGGSVPKLLIQATS